MLAPSDGVKLEVEYLVLKKKSNFEYQAKRAEKSHKGKYFFSPDLPLILY